MALPVNIDAVYQDDPLRPGRKAHQQHHDLLHVLYNDVETGGGVVTRSVFDATAVTLSTAQLITGAKTFSADLTASNLRTTYVQGLSGGTLGPYFDFTNFAGAAGLIQRNAAGVGLILRGAASQTADLQQWQNSSGTVLAAITASGNLNLDAGAAAIRFGSAGGTTLTRTQANGALTLTLQNFSGANLRVVNGEPGTPPLVIQGAVSQTADLHQWMNSAGSVLGSVTAAGKLQLGVPSYTGMAPNGLLSVGAVVTQAQFGIAVANSNTVQVAAHASGVTVLGGGNQNNVELRCHTTTALLASNASPQVLIPISAPAIIGSVVKGAVAQTGNLQEWQDSAATVLVSINNVGEMFTTTGIGIGVAVPSSVSLLARARSATGVPIIARGTSSQSADLQQWQDSASTVLTRINSAGQIAINGASGVASFYLNTSNSSLPGIVVRSNVGGAQTGNLFEARAAGNQVVTSVNPAGLLRVTAVSAGDIPLILQGAASQTGNLQEWQNSTPTTLVSVSAAGRFAATFAEGFRTLELGAADSAGTGFRTVRVPN